MKIIEQKLNNGIPVIMIPRKETELFTQVVVLRGGSRYETEEISGLSHFLEHTILKGTKKRPSAEAVAIDLENMGASQNAFTSSEKIAFKIEAPENFFEEATELLADELRNTLFNPEILEKEKGPILEELLRRESNPAAYTFELLKGLTYGNQSAGRMIIGNRDTIFSFTRDQAVSLKNDLLSKNNILIILVGNIPEEKFILKLLNSYYGDIQTSLSSTRLKLEDTNQTKSGLLIQYENIPQTQIKFGIKAPSRNDPDFFTTLVLGDILGHGRTSRLNLAIRTNRGLVYTVHAAPLFSMDTGQIILSAGTRPENVQEVVNIMQSEMDKLRQHKVPEAELARVKIMEQTSFKRLKESRNHLAGYVISQFTAQGSFQNFLHPDDYLRSYMNVTSEDIQRLAKKIFKSENYNLVLIGPHDKDFDPFN